MSSSQTPGRDSCGGIPVVWAQVARGPRPHTLLSMLLQPLLRFFDFKCYLFAGLLFSLVSLTERTPIASPKIPSSTVAASNFKSRNMIPNTSDFVRLSSVYVFSRLGLLSEFACCAVVLRVYTCYRCAQSSARTPKNTIFKIHGTRKPLQSNESN